MNKDVFCVGKIITMCQSIQQGFTKNCFRDFLHLFSWPCLIDPVRNPKISADKSDGSLKLFLQGPCDINTIQNYRTSVICIKGTGLLSMEP